MAKVVCWWCEGSYREANPDGSFPPCAECWDLGLIDVERNGMLDLASTGLLAHVRCNVCGEWLVRDVLDEHARAILATGAHWDCRSLSVDQVIAHHRGSAA